MVPIARPKNVGEGRYHLDCLLESMGWLSGNSTNTKWVQNDVVKLSESVLILQNLADVYDVKKFQIGNSSGGIH